MRGPPRSSRSQWFFFGHFQLVVSICFFFYSGSLGSFACFSGFGLLFPVLDPYLQYLRS